MINNPQAIPMPEITLIETDEKYDRLGTIDKEETIQ